MPLARIIRRRMKPSCRNFWSNAQLSYSRLRFQRHIVQVCYNGGNTHMTRACSTAGDFTPIKQVRWDSSWPAFVHEPQRSIVLGYFDTRFGITLTTFENFGLLLRHKTYCLLSATPHLERLAGLHV